MNEVEVKILDVNRESLERRLNALGAKKIFDGDIKAVFFDRADRGVRKKKDVIRLRKEGEKVVFTYKKFISNDPIKIMDETNVELFDFEDGKKCLEKLGLIPWTTMTKHRISYKLKNVRFEFDKHSDQYSLVPEFLEIEAEKKETIYKCAELLGFSKEDCKPWVIQEVAEHYKQKYRDAVQKCVENRFKTYQPMIEHVFRKIDSHDTGLAKAALTNMMANLYAQNYPITEMPVDVGNALYFYENMKKLRSTI